MNTIQTEHDHDDLRLDLNKLKENELEELARLVVRKLRILMKQEGERSGRS